MARTVKAELQTKDEITLAVFSLAASLVVLFLILPVIATLFGVSPASLWEAWGDEELIRSVGTTFLAGLIATGIGLTLGVPLAFLLARYRFPGKRLLEAVVDLPIVIPHTAAGIALLMVFGSRGVLGAPLADIGLFFVDSLAGIVVAMMFVSVPYLIDSSYAAFAALDKELEQVARTDGAGLWQIYWQICIPQAWRGIAGGGLLMWARGISEFGAVVILAYHPRILPTLIYERFNGFGLDAALPVAVVLILIAVVIFAVLRFIIRKDD